MSQVIPLGRLKSYKESLLLTNNIVAITKSECKQ